MYSLERRRQGSSSMQQYFHDLHRRYWRRNDIKGMSCDILIVRLGTLGSWLCIILLEFLVYSNRMNSSKMLFNFLFGFSYSLKNVNAIIYAAGAAAYGTSLEICLFAPFLIINSILAINNCGINHSEVKGSVLFMMTTMGLLLGTELAHQNFNSPGLRAIYNAARLRCPYVSEMNNRTMCLLIDMNHPTFTDNDSCMLDFATMATGFEQLRLIRDIALCSVAFYSMYNKTFLDITGIVSIAHKFVLGLFLMMSNSVIVVSIDRFRFREWKIYFDFIELLMFIIIIILLIFNLRRKCQHRHQMIMEVNPTIFG